MGRVRGATVRAPWSATRPRQPALPSGSARGGPRRQPGRCLGASPAGANTGTGYSGASGRSITGSHVPSGWRLLVHRLDRRTSDRLRARGPGQHRVGFVQLGHPGGVTGVGSGHEQPAHLLWLGRALIPQWWLVSGQFDGGVSSERAASSALMVAHAFPSHIRSIAERSSAIARAGIPSQWSAAVAIRSTIAMISSSGASAMNAATRASTSNRSLCWVVPNSLMLADGTRRSRHGVHYHHAPLSPCWDRTRPERPGHPLGLDGAASNTSGL
jgi:hypothetical protein